MSRPPAPKPVALARAAVALATVTLAGVLALACGGDDGGSAPAPPVTPWTGAVATDADGSLRFPEGFVFGAAVAGFQVDMGCPTLAPEACEDRGSDWYAFITSPETLSSPSAALSGDPPSTGPGFWELWPEDLRRADEELGLGGFRFSVEWSRIFPTATDGVEDHEALRALADAEALATYRAMLADLRARGIRPLVTLNHYTLPAWIHDAVGCHEDLAGCSPRGWVDKDRTVREIAKYAGFVARELGGEVDLWATLNEPFAVVLPGYILPSAERSNPPAVPGALAEAKIVFDALIEAHARMYDAVKAADTEDADGDGVASQIGIVYALAPVRPADPTRALDVQAAANVFHLWNTAFLDAVAAGMYDAKLDGNAVLREDLAGRMDYVGVNYYTRITVEGLEDPVLEDLSPLSTFNPLSLGLWEDYPRGLYEMLMLVQERYGLPSIVTENGLAIDDGDPEQAGSFLARHLAWVWRALRDGARVGGFFFWTLTDNYEWNHGFGLRFGLYRLEAGDATKARVARPVAATYAEITGARALPAATLARWPAPEAAP